jgi:AAA+ ATPase superfamily predicted ATPase
VTLRTIIPKIPDVIDELTWTGELVVKNNSKHDSYDLKLDYPKGSVFNTVDNLPPHNNLSAKQELRLKFSWLREYVHEPTGLQFRRGQIDTKYPLDKKEFVLTLEYANEKGKKFYTVLTKDDNGLRTDLFILRPKIK